MSDRRRIINSGAWSTGVSVTSLAGNLLLTVVMVRTLTVEDFGIYSYAVSLASIGITVMTAGLTSLAVKALVVDRRRNAEIMSSLALTRELFAILGYLLIAAISLAAGTGETATATLFVGLMLFSRAADVADLWYISHTSVHRTAPIRITTNACFLSLRIASLILVPDLWTLLILYVAESFVVTILILRRYLREASSPGFSSPSLRDSTKLIGKSWPLILADISNQANLRIDLVLIQALMGTTSVGIYSAASRLSEVIYFLPTQIMNAVFPTLLDRRSGTAADGRAHYDSLFQRAYNVAFWAGTASAIIIALLGPAVIGWFFGPAYSDAVDVLRIHVAACPFMFVGAVLNKWLIAEGYLWSAVTRHSLAAVVNIALNFFAIPHYGLEGAAATTVLSYVVASYLSMFLQRRTWHAGRQMSMAIVYPVRWLFSPHGQGA